MEIKMKNTKNLIALAMVSALVLGSAGLFVKPSPVFASADGHEGAEAEHKDHAEDKGDAHKDEHGHAGEENHEEGGDEHEEEGKATIDPQAAADMKMEIAEVKAAIIQSSIPVTGKISLNRNAMAEVKARFAGVVKTATKMQGEPVKAGDTLATVESNDSLQVYSVKSPIDGVVLARNTNIGHIAGDEPLYIVADLSKLWGEFHIFPKDMVSVSAGQKIRIKAVGGDLTNESTIASLLPLAESASQTVIARTEIDNAEGKWRPGMSVHGDIVTAEKSVPVAVMASAIQRIEGRPVVFVEKEGTYETRNVSLGLQDGEWAEVVEGLRAGERYVSTNSFVVKAQIGKAGAEHAH
jgi:cobalt-zinc-cadmium efflux system membrane fusion protein